MQRGTQRLNHPILDARAWRDAGPGPAPRWRMQLPAAARTWIDALAARATPAPDPVTGYRIDERDRAQGRDALRAVLDQLDTGCGFAVLEAFDAESQSMNTTLLRYWILAQALGTPIVQNIRGTLLFDVRDTGADVAQGARFSVTNARSSFHTDGAFLPGMPDRVGLLALKSARSGGENRIVSAYTLHNAIAERAPALLETLYQPFLFDRRGEYGAGEEPVSRSPVFRWDGRDLTMRYLDFYIREGYKRAGSTLTAAQNDALALVESILESGELEVRFSLRPGDVLLSNNHWILHDRNAYVDDLDPAQRRHLVRVWLARD